MPKDATGPASGATHRTAAFQAMIFEQAGGKKRQRANQKSVAG
jgi:hypothetical protein